MVFLHGSWTDSSQWVPVKRALSEDYHCFAVDLLGFGESENPKVHYSIALQVDFLEEFCETLNLQEIYLVGHSLGGWVAASYAVKYMERVRGLVLLTPEGVEVPGLENRWRRVALWMKGLSVLQFLRSPLLRLAKLLRLQPVVEDFLQQLETLQHSTVACQLLFQRRRPEINSELLQERLSSIKLPVSILCGDADTPGAMALSQAYADLLPNAQLHKIPDAGENLPLAFPDAVAQQIRALVDGERDEGIRA